MHRSLNCIPLTWTMLACIIFNGSDNDPFQLSRIMRLWHLSPSVNSIFKQACAAIHWATRLIFGQALRLLPYFMCANSEGSGETAWMHSLAWAFAVCLCDKYHKLMSWLNYTILRNHTPQKPLKKLCLVLSNCFHLSVSSEIFYTSLSIFYPCLVFKTKWARSCENVS